MLNHRLLPESGVVLLEPHGALHAVDFDALAAEIDPWIEAHGALRGLVVRAPELPGWDGPGTLLRHLRFLRAHRGKVRRVALVADGWAAEHLPKLVDPLVSDEVRHFDYADVEDALSWAGAREAG